MEEDVEHLLSFVTDRDGKQVFVHADLAGVEHVTNELNAMREALQDDDCPHFHLFSAEWGGWDLSTSKLSGQDDEANQVHHVKVYGWNEKWKEKHRLG